MTSFDTISENSLHSFHDDSIYAIRLISPQPDQNDWRSELVLDIDHILEWIKDDNGQISFCLVQANLCFGNVSDLRATFGCPDACINPLPIDRIVRSDEPVIAREGGYREFQWEIILNDQLADALEFRSSGYRLEKASWLNVVEGFFAKLTRRRFQRGVFR